MLTLQLFNGKTGDRISRLNMSSANWSDAINEAGTLQCSVNAWRGYDFRPYGHILALVEGNDVYHAGYLTRAKYSMETGLWELDAGGFMDILEKRLVLNYALSSNWSDGFVKVDEEHPSGNWPLKLKGGSYRDIMAKLVTETLKWGRLPVVTAPLDGGSRREFNYNSYDLATVAQRIEDIADMDSGPEFAFEPRIVEGGIIFVQTISGDGDELINSTWKWNTTIPSSGVILADSDYEGSDSMCTQSYGTGGRDQDKLLVARSVSSRLVDAGWPVMQIANKEHSSVSKVGTLKSYVTADTQAGDEPQRVHALKVDSRYRVRVGDWASVRYGTGQDDVLELKITDVSGSTESEVLEIQARERG